MCTLREYASPFRKHGRIPSAHASGFKDIRAEPKKNKTTNDRRDTLPRSPKRHAAHARASRTSRSCTPTVRAGLPTPQEPAWLTSGAMDAGAQAASRERRPGRPQRTSGDGAWAPPTSVTGEYQVLSVLRGAPAQGRQKSSRCGRGGHTLVERSPTPSPRLRKLPSRRSGETTCDRAVGPEKQAARAFQPGPPPFPVDSHRPAWGRVRSIGSPAITRSTAPRGTPSSARSGSPCRRPAWAPSAPRPPSWCSGPGGSCRPAPAWCEPP